MVGVIMVVPKVEAVQAVAVVEAVVLVLLVQMDRPPPRVEMVVPVFKFLQHLEIQHHQ